MCGGGWRGEVHRRNQQLLAERCWLSTHGPHRVVQSLGTLHSLAPHPAPLGTAEPSQPCPREALENKRCFQDSEEQLCLDLAEVSLLTVAEGARCNLECTLCPMGRC